MTDYGVFGEWDAPITDDLSQIDVPVGSLCIWCREKIKLGENGKVSPNAFVDEKGLVDPSFAEHRECSLRTVLGGIGHHVDHMKYCGTELGPDAGLTKRESSLMVWDYFQETQLAPTEAQQEKWQRKVEDARSRSTSQKNS